MPTVPRLKVNASRRWARELERGEASRTPPPGYVSLFSDDPPLAAMLMLGSASPRLSGGVGGWENVTRPHQTAMTVWGGVDPFELELELVLDGYASGHSVEPTLRALYAVAGGDPEVEPGIVEIEGIPWLPADRWVIQALELGDGTIRRGSDFSRVRAPLTLTLSEYVPPSFLRLRKGALKGGRGKTKVITVKKGDTPARIARRAKCKWTELRDLNVGVVTKANQNLKDGSKLRVPVAKAKHRSAKGSPRSRKNSSSRRSS